MRRLEPHEAGRGAARCAKTLTPAPSTPQSMADRVVGVPRAIRVRGVTGTGGSGDIFQSRSLARRMRSCPVGWRWAMSILYIIGAIVVIIVVLKLLGLY